MMKYVFVLFFILLLPLSSPAAEGEGKFTKHYQDSLFEITEKERYSVEIVIKEHELRVGKNKLDIIIHDAQDRDVVDADVQLIPWMPEMGHGVSDKAVITEKGGGLYSAENVVINMGGLWELKVAIKKGSAKDTVVFTFPDIPSGHHHDRKIHHGAGMAGIDTAMARKTENFLVQYVSDVSPVPINKIHSWQLTITTPGGKPVKGADIGIEGDMPAHGHGLPTEPEVTEEIKDGVYLVEGLKFSMPGHWVMKFHIEASDKKDTATFNLIVK